MTLSMLRDASPSYFLFFPLFSSHLSVLIFNPPSIPPYFSLFLYLCLSISIFISISPLFSLSLSLPLSLSSSLSIYLCFSLSSNPAPPPPPSFSLSLSLSHSLILSLSRTLTSSLPLFFNYSLPLHPYLSFFRQMQMFICLSLLLCLRLCRCTRSSYFSFQPIILVISLVFSPLIFPPLFTIPSSIHHSFSSIPLSHLLLSLLYCIFYSPSSSTR